MTAPADFGDLTVTVICKVMESVIRDVYRLLLLNGFFSNKQYGYIKGIHRENCLSVPANVITDYYSVWSTRRGN